MKIALTPDSVRRWRMIFHRDEAWEFISAQKYTRMFERIDQKVKMVIGKERSNWYKEHGQACTCVKCLDKSIAQKRFDSQTNGRKIGRNEKCPCGSGIKYKKCHAL